MYNPGREVFIYPSISAFSTHFIQGSLIGAFIRGIKKATHQFTLACCLFDFLFMNRGVSTAIETPHKKRCKDM